MRMKTCDLEYAVKAHGAEQRIDGFEKLVVVLKILQNPGVNQQGGFDVWMRFQPFQFGLQARQQFLPCCCRSYRKPDALLVELAPGKRTEVQVDHHGLHPTAHRSGDRVSIVWINHR